MLTRAQIESWLRLVARDEARALVRLDTLPGRERFQLDLLMEMLVVAGIDLAQAIDEAVKLGEELEGHDEAGR